MRTASFSCVAALLLSALGAQVVRGVEPVRAAIDACRPHIDVQVDVGYARIAARCPALVRLLESGEWESWLPRSWREPANDLSIGGLEELATSIEREHAQRRSGPRPGTAKLHEVLERLEAAQSRQHGAWERFRHWLATMFEQPAEDGSSAWLERLLQRATPTQVVIESITYIALGLIVALAVSIIVNELRAAGMFRRRGRRSEARAVSAIPGDAPPAPRQLEHASLQERPALLLRIVYDRLFQAGRLPRAVGLTIREAQKLVTFLEPADRARLAELTDVAERVRYAARPTATGVLSRAVEAGAALLAKLESAERQPS